MSKAQQSGVFVWDSKNQFEHLSGEADDSNDNYCDYKYDYGGNNDGEVQKLMCTFGNDSYGYNNINHDYNYENEYRNYNGYDSWSNFRDYICCDTYSKNNNYAHYRCDDVCGEPRFENDSFNYMSMNYDSNMYNHRVDSNCYEGCPGGGDDLSGETEQVNLSSVETLSNIDGIKDDLRRKCMEPAATSLLLQC